MIYNLSMIVIEILSKSKRIEKEQAIDSKQDEHLPCVIELYFPLING